MKRRNSVLKLLFMMTLTLVSALVIVACTPSNTDAADVLAAKTALEVGYTAPDNLNSVTQDVTLPATGANGVTITWQSSHPSVVSTTGDVTRPANDTNVTLTATLSKGEETDTKNFALKVIAAEVVTTPQEAIDALVITGDTLELEGMIYSTTSNIVIPTTSLGFTVNWVSTSNAITVAGVVTRPVYGAANERVILTASIGDVERDFIIDVIAIQEKPAEDVLSEALVALLLTTTATAENVTLPTELTIEGLTVDEIYEVSITWASDSVHMNASGRVDRPMAGEEDALVNLTATLSYGGQTATKEFSIVVYAYAESFTVVANFAEAQALFVAADSAARNDGVYVRVQDVSLVMREGDGLVLVDSEGGLMYAFGNLGVSYRDAEFDVLYDVIGALDIFNGALQISATKNSRKPTELIIQDGEAVYPDYETVGSILDFLPATQQTHSIDNIFEYKAITLTAKVVVNNVADNYGVLLADVTYTGDGSDLRASGGSPYENRAFVVYYKSNRDVFIPLDGLEVTVNVIVFSLRNDRNIYTVVFGGTIDDVIVGEIADEELMTMTKANLTSSIPTIIPTATTLNLFNSYLSADIEWASSNPSIISTAGVVTPPAEGQVEVKLTATITAGALTEDLEITILVGQLPLSTLEAALEAAVNTPLRVEVTVIGYSANNTVIVHDGTHAIAVFIGGGTTSDAATLIRASFGKRVILEGSKTVFNGLQQIQNVTAVEVLTTTAHTALSVDITELAWDAATLVEHQSKLVSITGAEISNKSVDSNDNITVTVKLGEKTIVLRWDSRIAITGTNVLVNAEIGDLIDIVNAPLGWNQNAPQLGYYVSTQAVVTTNPNLEIFTVTFMDGETELKSEDVVEGRRIASYPATAKEGFTFLGWFTDATLDTPWVDAPITEDVTLYAGYEEISGTLVVDTYTFTGLPTNQTSYVTTPTEFEVSGTSFTRLNANISTVTGLGTQGIVLGIRTGNNWQSPYLQFTDKIEGAYKVIFTVVNWTTDATNNLSYASGIYLQTSTDGVNWVNGVNFKDTWNVESSAVNELELMLTEDVYVRLFVESAGTQEGTFQLRLSVTKVEVHSYIELEEPVTVTFDQNFGEAEPVVVTLSSGDLAVEPAAPSRSGFDFLGWFEVEATEAFDFATPITTDIVLEARWEEQVADALTMLEALQVADGTLVKIVGVVTGFSDFNATFSNYDKVFLEDETGAIQVWRGAFPSDLAVGDKYEVEGEIDIFNGQVQIAQGSTLTLVDKGNAVSAPTDVTDVASVVAVDQAQRFNFVGTFVSVTSNGRDMVLNVGGTNVTVRSQSSSDSHPVNVHFLTGQAGQIVTVSAAHVEWATSIMRALIINPAQVTFADPTDAEILLAQQTALITYFDGKSFDMDTLINPAIDLDDTEISFTTEPVGAIIENKWMVVTEDTDVVITITLTRGEEAPVQFDVEVTIEFVETEEPGEPGDEVFATDLFISLYAEGAPGNRKAIQIFNGTGAAIVLDDVYTVKMGPNGGAWSATPITLTGTIEHGEVFVIVNNATDGGWYHDLANSSLNPNGDDAIGLFKNDVLIDVFGVQGEDPGAGWSLDGPGNGSDTVDKVVVRSSSVTGPSATWIRSEWTVALAIPSGGAATTDPQVSTMLQSFTWNPVTE